MASRFLAGQHPELGTVYAAIDPEARFTTPAVRPSRFAASLAPFCCEEAARAALKGAGAVEAEADGGR